MEFWLLDTDQATGLLRTHGVLHGEKQAMSELLTKLELEFAELTKNLHTLKQTDHEKNANVIALYYDFLKSQQT